MNSILFNKLLHSLVINIFTDYLVKYLFFCTISPNPWFTLNAKTISSLMVFGSLEVSQVNSKTTLTDCLIV